MKHILEVLGSSNLCVFDDSNMSIRFVEQSTNIEDLLLNNTTIRSVPIIRSNEKQLNIKSVAIATTKACNLKCSYCYAQDSCNTSKTQMTFIEVKEFLLKYIDPTTTPNPNIIFIGGEPLLNMQLLVDVTNWCKQQYKEPKFSVTTNGTLLFKNLKECVDEGSLDVSIAEWLLLHNYKVNISLDGPKQYHDKYRIYKNNTGTFKDIIANIAELRNTKSSLLRKLSFRCTTPYGADGETAIVDKLIFFNSFLQKGIGCSFFMATAAPDVYTEEEELLLTENIKKQYLIATEWFIKEIVQGKLPKWKNVINHPLKTLLSRTAKQYACGAGRGYVTLGFGGNIYACHRIDNSLIGTVSTGINPILRKSWAENGMTTNTGCYNCSHKTLCGGGCSQIAMRCNGTFNIPHALYCNEYAIKTSAALRILMNVGITKSKLLIGKK